MGATKTSVLKGSPMRFYEFDWREMEPDLYTVCAMAYLDAKGLVFGENFDHTNACSLAEAFYREELLLSERMSN